MFGSASKLRLKFVEPSDQSTRSTVSKLKESKALNKIQQIYLKKQPQNIKQFLDQNNKKTEAKILSLADTELIQEQLENEALDLSPGEISE